MKHSVIFSLGAVVAAPTLSILPAAARHTFDATPVSNTVLGVTRGGYMLTAPELERLQDDVANADRRVFGATTSTSLDNWWAQDGASLIAAGSASRK